MQSMNGIQIYEVVTRPHCVKYHKCMTEALQRLGTFKCAGHCPDYKPRF